ncbi:MAG: acyltransferase family protein [Eubacteriales bacterium]|nr:acyltransferase family protein [Eubacteriales bacterium]
MGQRDAALDNLKGLLIISVVYVHFYDMLGQKTALLFTIRTLVLTVQMPLFVFLCGYFGKNAEKRRRTAWEDYLIPFLIFNTLYYLVRVGQEPDIKYGLLRPLNMYWFLMTLLIIRLLMPELLRIRHLLPLSIVLALIAGGDAYFGRTLSLSRTVCFLPFYLLGYFCTQEQMQRIRKIPLPVAFAGAAGGALLSLWLTDTLKVEKGASHPFQLVNSYATQGLDPWEGAAFRLGIYIAAPLLGILLIRLIPARHGILTGIGRGSMTVYLLHAFPMLWVVGHWEFVCGVINWLIPAFQGVDYPGRLCCGIPQVIALALYSFVVSCLLSCKPVTRAYDRCMAGLQHMLFRTEKTGKSEKEVESVQEIH